MSSPHPSPARRLSAVPPLDWLMLVLALASIGLLLWEDFGTLSEAQLQFVRYADLGVCALFFCEFLWRWRQVGWSGSYLKRNWYELLGMIPAPYAALRAFRLFRILRIVILLARFGMAADRAFGEDFTYRLINRFKRQIVEQISGAVTTAVLREVEQVLTMGTYTRNISRALEENQTELRNMVLEKLKQDRQTGMLKRLPFYDEIVQSVIDAVMRVGEEVLRDPRTDELVSDLLRENIQQIRRAVEAKENSKELAEAMERREAETPGH